MILWQKIVASQHYSYLNTSVQYWHIWATVASVMHVYGCNSHDKGGGGGGGHSMQLERNIQAGQEPLQENRVTLFKNVIFFFCCSTCSAVLIAKFKVVVV